jgi:hypothetical protein
LPFTIDFSMRDIALYTILSFALIVVPSSFVKPMLPPIYAA